MQLKIMKSRMKSHWAHQLKTLTVLKKNVFGQGQRGIQSHKQISYDKCAAKSMKSNKD